MVEFNSTITCPHCNGQTKQKMPIDSCVYFFDCPACGKQLKPVAGDCCVFCSYGNMKCPPIQQGECC